MNYHISFNPKERGFYHICESKVNARRCGEIVCEIKTDFPVTLNAVRDQMPRPMAAINLQGHGIRLTRHREYGVKDLEHLLQILKKSTRYKVLEVKKI